MSRLLSILKDRENVEIPSKGGASSALEIDRRLFERFFGGDDTALMELFDRHTHRLYLYCLKFLGDRQVAEDVVQDLWERVIRLRTRRESPPENPVGYLIRMARNLSLNSIRDRRDHTQLEELPEDQHPKSDPIGLTYYEELVTAALPRLPDDQREVLILNAYSGYRFEEIAVMLGENVGAIRTRAWRARKGLAKLVAALMDMEEAANSGIDPGESGDDDDE